jgi:hypothetical protein
MSKKIDINPRPQVAARADTWVGRPAAVPMAGQTKRLTVDVPAETHARFKAYCAMRQTRMAGEINAFIERCLAESD